jgi:hypothetical protein
VAPDEGRAILHGLQRLDAEARVALRIAFPPADVGSVLERVRSLFDGSADAPEPRIGIFADQGVLRWALAGPVGDAEQYSRELAALRDSLRAAGAEMVMTCPPVGWERGGAGPEADSRGRIERELAEAFDPGGVLTDVREGTAAEVAGGVA